MEGKEVRRWSNAFMLSVAMQILDTEIVDILWKNEIYSHCILVVGSL